MLLVGHEHIMKIDETVMNWLLVLLGLFLIYTAFFIEKKHKAHIMAYCMFP